MKRFNHTAINHQMINTVTVHYDDIMDPYSPTNLKNILV